MFLVTGRMEWRKRTVTLLGWYVLFGMVFVGAEVFLRLIGRVI
jgi:hypothetical protein